MAAGAVVAPGAVTRRGFLARLAVYVTGAAVAAMPDPVEEKEPFAGLARTTYPALHSNVYAQPRALTESLMRDVASRMVQHDGSVVTDFPVNLWAAHRLASGWRP